MSEPICEPICFARFFLCLRTSRLAFSQSTGPSPAGSISRNIALIDGTLSSASNDHLVVPPPPDSWFPEAGGEGAHGPGIRDADSGLACSNGDGPGSKYDGFPAMPFTPAAFAVFP
ncbi:MAG: hypothetical protein HC767_00590 [Akkermansiaceae bacterium]|nr:hypothetical protein [Akkermansiaceae bacterium]